MLIRVNNRKKMRPFVLNILSIDAKPGGVIRCAGTRKQHPRLLSLSTVWFLR